MAEVQKLSVALTREQVRALRGVVMAGEYATVSEVLREAVRDWQTKRELRQHELRQARERGAATPGESPEPR